MRISVWLGVLLALLLITYSASGASLWQENNTSVFSDLVARNVGDLVTVIIVERAEASQSAGISTGKDSSTEFGPGVGILDFIPLAGAKPKNGLKTSGQNTQGGSLSAKMTGRVAEVLPNGNLVIEGRQTIAVNREEQEIIVRGIIRPTDIAPDNTILSTYVSDASISYQGSGALGGQQKAGVLTRILNWIF